MIRPNDTLAGCTKTVLFALSLAASAPSALAVPFLTDPGVGTLQQVAQDSVMLDRVDGLTFDVFGNLYAALEIEGSSGKVVYIDHTDGSITSLITGISRAVP